MHNSNSLSLKVPLSADDKDRMFNAHFEQAVILYSQSFG